MYVARSISRNFTRIARPNVLFSASVHYAHPSWKSNRPVEYWIYNNDTAVSKLVSLKDLKIELVEGALEKEFETLSACSTKTANGPAFSRWFLFSGRDEVTSKAILEAFNINVPSRSGNVSSRAKVDFIMGKTRSTDHLLLRVHDLRLQQHDHDGDEGDVDDIAWLQVRPLIHGAASSPRSFRFETCTYFHSSHRISSSSVDFPLLTWSIPGVHSRAYTAEIRRRRR